MDVQLVFFYTKRSITLGHKDPISTSPNGVTSDIGCMMMLEVDTGIANIFKDIIGNHRSPGEGKAILTPSH